MVATAIGSLGAPLLPTIMGDDHVSLSSSQWALTISLVSGAVAIPVLGRLGDGRRRREVTLATAATTGLGCVLAALPGGFTWLLVGRALQGVGLALVPLAMTVARDALPEARVRPAIALLGVTTVVGIGIGYPLAGVIVESLGLAAAFWFGAMVSGAALVAAWVVLPDSPSRAGRRLDIPGALLLCGSVSGLLVVLAEGQSWGWTSSEVLGIGVASLVLLTAWVLVELRSPAPLVDVRLVRRRSLFSANSTMLLIGFGIYPLLSLVSRLVQTPTSAGYGFGSSVIVAGAMLVPFSVASFAANRVALPLVRRTSPEFVVAASCVVLLGSMVLFLLARDALWEIVVTMALAGLGVGCVFASNPLQIVRGVPPEETGSAMGFYGVVRSVSFSAGSALSATVLVIYVPRGRSLPTDGAYSVAAWISIGVLLAALALAGALAVSERTALASQPR
jgi:MFS family permease